MLVILMSGCPGVVDEWSLDDQFSWPTKEGLYDVQSLNHSRDVMVLNLFQLTFWLKWLCARVVWACGSFFFFMG